MRGKLAASAAAVAFAVTSLATPAAGAEPGDSVEFDNPFLQTCVRDALGLPNGSAVTYSAILGLTSLECVGIGSSSLEGLSAATNLTSLSLPLAESSNWDALSALTALKNLDLSDSNVASLDWLDGATELTNVTLDRTAATDLGVLASKPLTTLSIRSMGLADIDFLDGNYSLGELHFDDNDVDDISVLHTLPALKTVTFDWNQVVDVTPLATLSALTTWSAKNERGTLPAIAACAQLSLTGGSDIDGTSYDLLALDVPNDVVSFVAPFNGPVTLVTRSGSSNYSARLVAQASGYTAPCAWPTEYLPTFTFPTALLVGKMATIEIDSWGTRYVDPEYKWTLDDDTVGATTRSVVPQADGLGRSVTPSAITRADGMQTVTVTGPKLTIMGVHPADATFGFAGPPTVGSAPELSPDREWPSVTLTCEWLVDGSPVSTTANCAWVIPSSAAGKQLSARITVHRTNYVDRTYDVAAATIVRAFAKATAGYIVGTPDVGQVLRLAPIDTTSWSPAPTSRTYQWLRNGVAIDGATASTYTLQAPDAGAAISVEVTGHKAGYRPVTIETPSITVHRLFTAKPAPAVSGTLAVGHTLTVKRGTWSPAPSSYAYQWYRDGKAISGATHSTYKAVTADGGHKVSVKVTAKKSGYTTASKTSPATTVLKKLTKTPTPTVTGTAKVKSTLTAHAGTWAPGTVTKSYQWYRNGKAISGATKATYKVGVRDAYASITVKVTGKKSGYLTTAKTSAAKKPIGIMYKTCAALKADYPGGVAKSSSTKGISAATYVSSALYSLNAARDGDKDGWACE